MHFLHLEIGQFSPHLGVIWEMHRLEKFRKVQRRKLLKTEFGVKKQSFKNEKLALSRRLAAKESIAVQWVLMAPHPMGSPFYNGFVCIVRPFAPPEEGPPPCLSHGSRWVAPPIRGWGHPSAQRIETPVTENLKNYCL